jgi:hypothetical protein
VVRRQSGLIDRIVPVVGGVAVPAVGAAAWWIGQPKSSSSR